MQSMIFLPATAMVFLVAIVMVRMGSERARQVREQRISLRDIPSGSQMAANFKDTRAADNYKNLFEAPVLFYLALSVAYMTAQVTPVILSLAWAYVGLRFIHSFIHCTYNRILHRFLAYMASSLVLWTFWGVLTIGIISK